LEPPVPHAISRRQLATALLAVALLAVALPVLSATATGAQTPPAAPPDGSLVIGGDLSKPMTVTLGELKQLSRTTVVVKEEGREIKYEGVLVGELLKRAGAPIGQDMGGRAVASYLLASAKDGYQAVYAIAEVDPAFTDSEIIVADTVDGTPLFEYQGPLRLVAPHDKRGARSVRMLQRLDLVRLRK
jgi:DMSO/TMAO reductase YedYZ molybdopterin-dependent catalytic subunit